MDFRPGDWLCSCGAHNYASKSACFKCKIPRDAAGGSQQAGYQQQSPYQQQPLGGYQQQPPQQQYQAQPYSNYANSLTGGLGAGVAGYGNGGYAHEPEPDYSQYSQQQPSFQPPQPPSQQQRYGGGDLNVRDPGFDSFRANVAGASQAALQQALAGFDASVLFPGLISSTTNPIPANFRPGDWFCMCGNHNYAIRTACGKCGKTKAGTPGSALPGNFRPGDWMCKCGNHNYQSRNVCGKCQETKDNVKPTAPQMAPNFQVGDWMCICGAHNYQSKTICYKCNLAKESAQAELPATTTPGFRPGDWLCESCKNHNYASRIVCGRCKTPKSAEESQRERSPTPATRERSRSPKR